ncbi:hypothetical protein Pint_13427 [Pistacia integerrima]|uniref:Uncharacterized protein n=1 Tax=Pistacia integerrima TaxID=434235 RepID=A0ACC0Y606_9ROSI|nr:hypothetical protein Pint_13427 [Pistacia integerrima]
MLTYSSHIPTWPHNYTSSASAPMDDKEKLHIAMFPWLAYGHIMPFFQVAKFLVEKGHHVYFISTPKNIHRLPQIPNNLSSQLNFVQLPLPHVQGLPEGAESPG